MKINQDNRKVRFWFCFGLKEVLPKCYRSWFFIIQEKKKKARIFIADFNFPFGKYCFPCTVVPQYIHVFLPCMAYNLDLYKKEIAQRESRKFRNNLWLVCCYCKNCPCIFILVGFVNSEKHGSLFVSSTLIVLRSALCFPKGHQDTADGWECPRLWLIHVLFSLIIYCARLHIQTYFYA